MLIGSSMADPRLPGFSSAMQMAMAMANGLKLMVDVDVVVVRRYVCSVR